MHSAFWRRTRNCWVGLVVGNFGAGATRSCGPPKELDIAHEYSKQPNLFDGPRIRSWRPFINQARDGIAMFTGSIKMLHEALAEMESAKSIAAPRSQPYLAFLINRTEAYILHLETIVAWQQAYIDFDSAFQLKGEGRRPGRVCETPRCQPDQLSNRPGQSRGHGKKMV